MGNTPAKHQQSQNRPKKNVRWKSAEHPSAPGKPMLVTAFDSPPDVVTLKWDRPRTDGGSPIIGFLVEHRRTGSPNWSKATASLVMYPELSISGLEPGWRYQFRVSAQNVVGLSEPSEVSEPLTVTLQRNAITAPRFLNELRDTVALENEQCEFVVNVAGTPAPQINWFKDGFEIFSSRRTKIINDNGTSTLIVHQIALTDEGEIKCTASNRAGHGVTIAQLKVEAPPRIRLPRQYEDGLLVEAGETMRLKVGIAGRPTPTITWSHNGETIRSGARIDLLTNEKNSFLKISNATRADRGEYHLRAVNKLGEFSISFLVTVTAKPSPPGKVKIAMTLGKTVTLSWSAPEDDGGCKIGNYILEYFRVGWNVWLKAAATRQLNTTLNDLIEGSEYRFRVKAESPYGLSEPSEESNVLFVPDHKRGILKPANERRKLDDEIKANISAKRLPRPAKLTKQMVDKTVTLTKTVKKPVAVNHIKITGIPKNVKLIPQIFDNESLSNEMSYGTKVDTIYKKSEQNIPKMKVIKAACSNSSQQKLSNEKKGQNKIFDKAPNVIKPILKFDEQTSTNHSDALQSFVRSDQNMSAANQRYSLETPRDNNDEVHTSSEFVLVLYDEEEDDHENNNETQHLDLKSESLLPPPLSLSAPDLRSELPSPPPMRRSASSTELLYEKAMQKFYQAVEIEEAENERKRSMSIGPKSRSHAQPHEYSSLANTKSFTFDDADHEPHRKTSLTKYNSLDEHRSKEPVEDSGSDTYESNWDEEDGSEYDRDIKKEIMESQQKPAMEFVYEDDYTESTVSTCSVSAATSMESIEQFINNIRSTSNNIRKNSDDELETYHPKMEARALSPYCTSEPGQAAIILSKALTLPDPDYVPKPILKRPNNENKTNEEGEVEYPKAAIKTEKKSFLQIFDRKKAPSNDNLRSSQDELGNGTVAVARTDTKQTLENNECKKSAFVRRQISDEENKVVIDYYSDLVRELGGIGRARVPIYMRGQAKSDGEHVQSDASEKLNDNGKSVKSNSDSGSKKVATSATTVEKQTPNKPPQQNRIEKSERANEMVKVSPSMERLASPDRGNLVEISVEHTQSISYALREIKQGSVTRDEAPKLAEKREEQPPAIGPTPMCNFNAASHSRSSSITRARPADVCRKTSASPAPVQRRTLSRTRTTARSVSKSPASHTRTSLTSTVLKVTRLPLNENFENIAINLSPSISLSPSPEPGYRTPEELMEEAEVKVKSSMSYATDVAMFLLACWFYLFKDARLAIPILALMVYRQLQSILAEKYANWTKRRKS